MLFSYNTQISYNTDINPFIANYFINSIPKWNLNTEVINFGGACSRNTYPFLNFNYNYNYGFSNPYYFNYPTFKYGGVINFNGTKPSIATESTTTSSNPKTTNNEQTTAANKTSQTSNTSTSKNSTLEPDDNMANALLNTARKYSNANEKDHSQEKFCINKGCHSDNYGEWCTDYVTYVVKEAYKKSNKKLPDGFGTHDVQEMKNWAQNSNEKSVKFISTKNQKKKAEYLKQNIKPGDIFIMNENGASHTGFVTSINSDGSFNTIEGNRDDRVKNYRYSPDFSQLSGFIRLT